VKGQVKVKGVRELQRALAKGDTEQKKRVRLVFKEVGDIVREEATSRFAGIDARSAAGFKTRVQQRGVKVQQSRRKVTGLRGDYGALQMRRALVPALGDKEHEVLEAFEDALDKVVDIVDG
jgi:hypothetical protein